MSLAAAYTGIVVEYVDGVTALGDKALPPKDEGIQVNEKSLYAWRAHMNVMRK